MNGFGLSTRLPPRVPPGGASEGLKARQSLQSCRHPSETVEMAGDDDEDQGEDGYGDFADEANDKGTEALLAHFAEVGAEADAREGEQEGPAR